MPTMKLKFSKVPNKFTGGERYTIGKWYYLDSMEACLWIKREVVDMKTVEPCNFTDECQAENDKNTGEGPTLSRIEIIAALADIAA